MRQLIKPGAPPQFGPPKNGKPRTITLTPKTIDLLRQHKAQQAQVKLANRGIYQDCGLVFAKDWWGLRTHGATLGHPLQSNAIGQREFKRLLAQTGVKSITSSSMACGTPVQRCFYKLVCLCMWFRSAWGISASKSPSGSMPTSCPQRNKTPPRSSLHCSRRKHGACMAASSERVAGLSKANCFSR